MQKDMLEVLQREGFQINDRELLRLRLRFKWLLRESTAKKDNGDGSVEKPRKTRKRKVVAGSGLINQLANAILQEESSSGEDETDDGQGAPVAETPADEYVQKDADPQPLDPEEAFRRQLRVEQLQIESAEKWRTRKRRRRTRGWAGLPADAPGEPPRFPSETTLDESKAYLNLDNNLYRQIRKHFQKICEEQGVMKKTLAGPEKWGQVKHQLLRENEHLSAVFQQDPDAIQQIGTTPTPSNFKALSLDVICTDVTKRMRTAGSKMGLPEAKNTLGLNPEEARQVRAAFHTILKADHFTNKYEAGEQHWEDLKRTWIQQSALLTRVLAGGEADPQHANKTKAIEVLGRDIMKRLRAENCQKDPTKKKQVNEGPGPGPAPPTVTPHASKALRTNQQQKPTSDSNNKAQAQSRVPATLHLSSLSNSSDLQIDPSLLLAASDPSMIPESTHDSMLHQQPHTNHNSYTLAPQFFNSLPLPIYFRLHPHSSTNMPNKTVWLGILQAGSVSELRNLAMREHPGTMVIKIEGLVMHKMQGHADREVMFTIDDEDELAAYLQHVAGGKATFVVLLGLAHGHTPVGAGSYV